MFRATVLSVFVLAAIPASTAWAGDPSAEADKSVCRKIIDRYAALLKADPQAPFRGRDYAPSPLTLLTEAKTSGVAIAADAELADFNKDPRRALEEWGKQQTPPVTFAKNAVDGLAQLSASSTKVRIDRLPDTPLYRVSTIAGTALCYTGEYFQVTNGRAELVHGPESWNEENGAGCGIDRTFGKVDDAPVAFEDNYAEGGPEFGSDLVAESWNGAAFAPACTIHFEFKPRLLWQTTYNHWDQSCTAENCAALRQAALEIVAAAEAHAGATQKFLVDKLTAPQRDDFAAMLKLLNEPEAASDVGRLDITDRSPLLLPLVADKTLYLARAGRATIGWRIFSDWIIVIERRDKDAMKEIAQIAIGVGKGKLISAEVK